MSNARGKVFMELDDDRELVRRMLSGNQRAYDEFFKAYFDRLYRFALVRLNNDSDAAEDAVQQTLQGRSSIVHVVVHDLS